ncbi:butyrophilin-like protein 2 [Acanthopagrus schlegelii]
MEPIAGLSFGIFFILLFQLTMILRLLSFRGALTSLVESQLSHSDQPIVALAGDDVILPCQLQPAVSASSETILWTRPGLDPKSPGCSILRSCKLEPDDGRSFGAFFFLTVILINCHGVASELICSDQPIVALAGDDVILPCQLQPAVSVSSEMLLWTRPGLDPKYIHVHQDGRPMLMGQNRLYNNRTALFVDQLINGNVSLKLFRVKLSDAGRYTCIIDSKQMEASIQLTVGAASTPVVNITGFDRGAVVLQCNSTGWYPEPEVFWLDGEGNLLSAGPTETVRGPDDLYTVSSRVTVEKRHSNSFTCRVQQNHTNLIREAQIHVPDDFFMVPLLIAITVGVGVAVFLVIGLCWILYYRRQQQDDERKAAVLLKRNQKVKKHDVGAASTPVVNKTGFDRGAVVLQCESTGWYPEPEVFWLDGEGNLLSAGPTETVRGPDDLYTVSSRVTVEKRHSNSFTCRVQQNHINQTREAHIHVPDDFFMVPLPIAVTAGVGVAVFLVIGLCWILCNRRQQQDDERKAAVLLKRNQKVKKHDVSEKSCEDNPMLNLEKKQLEDQGGQLERVVVL